MSKLCTGVLALVFAGCVMVPDYQRVSSDEIVRAYDLAARVDADTRSFAAVSSNVNKTAGEMGQAVAAAGGLAYMGYYSDEAASTTVMAEIGPLDSWSALPVGAAALDLALPGSVVILGDAALDIRPLPVIEKR